MKRFLSVLLIVTLCFSMLSACERSSELYLEDFISDYSTDYTGLSEESEPSLSETSSSEAENLDVLTFQYNDGYLEEYYTKLEAYKDVALGGTSADSLEEIDIELDELFSFLSDQQTIAMVLYYCDLSDEEASELHLDMTEVVTEAQEKTFEVLQEIYKSDSKLKDEIFSDFTQEEIQELLDYNTDVKEIQQRYSEIIVEFQALDDDQLEYETGPLYAELVSNYNRLAQIYGYDNFYEYSYDRVYSRDYTNTEIQKMRTFAKNYLVPAYTKAAVNFNANYELLSDLEKSQLSQFIFSDYDDVDYLDQYLNALPEDVRNDMQTLFDGNVVFPQSEGAFDGAFTTTIADKPFCYFSRDNKDTGTVIHEMGHYYGSLYCDLDEIPLDLAEVQSQGHEWLMIADMEDELETDVYDCYLDYRLVNDMATILISLMVDEFEERVYNAEGVENYTAAEFEQIMSEVCEGYGGIGFVEENITDIQNYWRLVTLEHPVYYVSYAVSMIPSLDMYFVASEDWNAALDIYLGLTRDVEEESAFLPALKDAGLASPFEVEVYQAIADRYGIHVEGLEN